jgi:hypothetical protein
MNNPKGPNSNKEQLQLSQILDIGADKLQNVSINDLTLGSTSRFLAERSKLLSSTIGLVDKPILKGLATDMINVMSGWLSNPETLCCIIQGLWSIHTDSNKTYTLQDTKFGDFLDSLIAFIDLIIVLLTQDIRKLVIFFPDFIKEIMKMVMGAILLLIQETLFAVRDSVINTLLEWLRSKSNTGDKIWAQCLPLSQMLKIIQRYISDYGIIADLMEKIKGWVSGQKSDASDLAKVLPNIKDLEFLKWLRDLLVKLKQATINFDLCVEQEFFPNDVVPALTGSTNNDPITIATGQQLIRGPVPIAAIPNIMSFDNGQIAVNGSKIPVGDQTPDQLGKWRSRISQDSIVTFGEKYMGIPREIMENAYTKISDQDIGGLLGPNSSNLDPCPGFTRAAKYFGFTQRGKQ